MKRSKPRPERLKNGAKGSSPPRTTEPNSSPIDSSPAPVWPASGLVPQGPGPLHSELSQRIPPILLEGDEPARPANAGPGEKFALGPTSSNTHAAVQERELPEAYGTGRLFLTARDPHCLYACWDLTAEQQRLCNSLSAHRHLVVRVHEEARRARPIDEVHVHPESRHWFIHVERAGRTYVAELGYTQPDGQFRTVAVSDPVATPHSAPAEESAAEFKTIAVEAAAQAAAPPASFPVPSAPPVAAPIIPHQQPQHRQPRAEAPQPAPARLAAAGEPRAQNPTPAVAPRFTVEQERTLAELTGWTVVTAQSPCSAEIAALLQRAAQAPVSPAEVGPFPMPLGVPPQIAGAEGGIVPEISSPPGGEFSAQKSFWLNINAELVIYGKTEPDALVTIGGRAVQLRPDGSFSCRFALPDGFYQLPVSAVAANGDARQVKLEFYRGTRYRGEAGTHPRDPSIEPPPKEAS